MRMRPAVVLLVALGIATAGPVASVRGQDEDGQQGVLARVVSRLLTTETSRVEIGRIDGVLSSTATIHGIRVSDADGVWLSLGRAELDWSRAALFRGRLQVTELTLTDLDIARRPPPTPRPEEVADGPLLPEVPVEIVVERFALDRLTLGESILGEPVALAAEGSARLGDPAQGLSLDFEARRLDAEGSLGIDLAYVPETGRLALALEHQEPAGGVLARLLDVPGLPPVRLTLAGDAPLDAFEADLDFEAGEDIGARGRAAVARVGEAHRIDLDVVGRIAGLLPRGAAPLFAGETRLSGVAEVGEGVVVERLDLATDTTRYMLEGRIGGEPGLDLRLTGGTRPDAAGPLTLGETTLEAFDLDLAVAGALAAPSARGTVSAREVTTAAGRAGRLALAIDAVPVEESAPAASPPDDEPPAARWRVDLTADAEALALSDPLLADLVGSSARLVADGTIDTAGLADLAEARLETDTAEAVWRGLVSRRTVEGVLEARLPDLAALEAGAPWMTGGSANVTAQVTADPFAGTAEAVLDGAIDAFSADVAILDALAGETVRLEGIVSATPSGYAARTLRLDGEDVRIVLDGALDRGRLDLALDARVSRLDALNERITAGAATLVARLEGASDSPTLTGDLAVRDAVALGRAIPALDLGVSIEDPTGALEARLTLDGTVAGEAARGEARVSAREGGLSLDALDLEVGSVALTGALVVSEALLAEGEVRLAAGDLADIAPLVLADVAGALDALITLSVEDDGQAATVALEARALRVDTIGVETVRIEALGRDLLGAPQVDGSARAEQASAFGETFREVSVEAQATRAATEFTFEAISGDVRYRTSGTLGPGDPVPQLDLRDLSVGPPP